MVTPKSVSLEDRMAQHMLKAMQAELDKIAEPIIEKALADIQVQLKQRMGSIAIGMLSSTYDIQLDKDRLMITVRIKEPT